MHQIGFLKGVNHKYVISWHFGISVTFQMEGMTIVKMVF
jgi:hypothetical protein